MTRVKICGLRDVDTAVAAARAGADIIGLVFAESRRQVTPQQCTDIVDALHELRRSPGPFPFEAPDRDIRRSSWFGAWSEAIDDAIPRARPLIAGVFADQPLADVNAISEAARLDLVQLSSGEDDAFVRGAMVPAIRVVHVEATMDAETVLEAAPAGVGAVVMLDAGRDGARGGTGEAFDWEVAAAVARRVPIILAGGLTPENVAAAIAQVGPWAVDVSSGVETNGSKDIEKIRAFIRAVKEADRGR